jgi:hypothetical protein
MATDPKDADRYPTISPGMVPADWCSSRTIGTARHDGPFADSLAHQTNGASRATPRDDFCDPERDRQPDGRRHTA